jgi:hypothetical protein
MKAARPSNSEARRKCRSSVRRLTELGDVSSRLWRAGEQVGEQAPRSPAKRGEQGWHSAQSDQTQIRWYLRRSEEYATRTLSPLLPASGLISSHLEYQLENPAVGALQ